MERKYFEPHHRDEKSPLPIFPKIQALNRELDEIVERIYPPGSGEYAHVQES